MTAFNAASPPLKIFGGTLPGVNLTAPIDLEITLVRLFTVSVQKEGDGSGTVTSSPVGIDCGVNCANQFPEGTPVALNAAADPGSIFAGWSGGCFGTGACSVTGNATVTARFNVAVSTDRLTVNIGGGGTGSIVTSNPSGISCQGTCAAEFATGSSVTLTAATTNVSTFNGWSGGGCSGTGPCVVVMVGNPTVTATFTAAPSLLSLTVTKSGAGTDTVSSDPPGITACSSTCTANYATGTIVTLTATPQRGSTFAAWGGACSGTGPCSVDMNGNRAVTATFNPPVGMSNLTVQKIGTGSGTVTSQPAGIDCGQICVAGFPTGTVVTLPAAPAPGSTFFGWRTGPCTGTVPCSVAMTKDHVAQFDLAPDLVTLNVDKSGGGNGTVTSDPAGIFCDPTCQANYLRGTVVTLTPVANEGSSFDEWRGGACNNQRGPCVLLMDDNRSANARFVEAN